jgi:hypothetical protein
MDMPIVKEIPIKVYAKFNTSGLLIEDPQSSVFLQELEGWTRIDECPSDADQETRDKYAHAQSNYLPGPARTQEGIPRFRWDGEKVVERTAEEIAIGIAALPSPAPSETEIMKQELLQTQEALASLYEIVVLGGGNVEP